MTPRLARRPLGIDDERPIMAKLTKTAVDNAKAPEKGDAWLWDSELEGFGVRIQASGRKTYVIRYRAKATGTQRKMTIARCTDMPPEKARELARKEFAKVAEGQDPVGERKPEVVSKAKRPTVDAMFKAYVANLRAKGRVSADEVERALLLSGNNAADALGRDREAAEVEPIEVVDYLSGFYQQGLRGAADKHRSYIASAYTWAMRSANDYTAESRQDWGIIRNPAADVAKDAGAIKTRDRNLSPEELRTLWDATDTDAAAFSQKIAACIRLLIGCGQRVQETLRMEGCEIDLVKRLWRMPAHKTKGRKLPHTVPLPVQVIPVLRDLIAMHGDGLLFQTEAADGTLIEHQAVGRAITRWMARKDVSMEHFQTRDLRRTWKSRSHDAGIDRFTRDLIQQHAKNDTGTKNYDRANYLPQMTQAMDKWSAWLDCVLAGKVVTGPWEGAVAA